MLLFSNWSSPSSQRIKDFESAATRRRSDEATRRRGDEKDEAIAATRRRSDEATWRQGDEATKFLFQLHQKVSAVLDEVVCFCSATGCHHRRKESKILKQKVRHDRVCGHRLAQYQNVIQRRTNIYVEQQISSNYFQRI